MCNFVMKQFWIIAMHWAIFGKISEGKDMDLKFPKDLAFGVASSSHQVEGAWNVSGKSQNVWDWWTHNHPEAILDRSNADIACNSYYKYKEDVKRIKSIGMDFYRFSISWSRILSDGLTTVINKEGLQYYKNLTAELKANGIEPVVTIYHWDHPQIMEDMGGWTNELIVDWFVSYAKILFEELGDSVKIWITINEPQTLCDFGYEDGFIELAPGKKLNGSGIYQCGHNVLKAHAMTYHMYDKVFRPTQRGQIGLVNALVAFLAENPGDTVSVDTAFQFSCGWFAHPIYFRDYPEIMKTRIAMISKLQGHPRSRLPEFSEEWLSIIHGTSDYFGLNHYTSRLVAPDPDEEFGIYNTDAGLTMGVDPSWPVASLPWLYVYPPGFSFLMRQIKDEFNNPQVRVMENGYTDEGELDDCDRINYHNEYVKELLIAMKRDHCNIKSYAVWSIMDNFEWNSGYTSKFGIISVDFNDPNRTRTSKLSTTWWTDVLAARKLQPLPTNCNSSNMKLWK